MKTPLLRYFSLITLLLFVIACSTKKNTFLSRNSHALSSKYNILYNGEVALDKGIIDLKSQYRDNFWAQLPIERMQITKEAALPGQPAAANANFDRAELKATKAIQKHSMNIAGSEKNPQMDEAHLMLGKARYYDQRFVPALEAFNYILYKYPSSDKIYEAKIWREKTNMRMDNDALAATNLQKLLKEIKFKDQIYADANAALAQAFLNLSEQDSAIAKIKLAKEFTKENEEKARYNFILGQLYEELGYKDSAFASYQSVIDMKRNAARQYVIQAHARQASQFDFKSGDTIVFLEKYNDLLKDRENRPFLDNLNHQMALFYSGFKDFDKAKKYYNKSLDNRTQDQYLTASNYRNLADINFNDAKYVTAGKYYDSTLVQLDQRGREFRAIKKKRENLVDVIKYEAIATRNDSIITVFKMTPPDQITYYNAYIEKLKKEEEIAKAKKALELQNQMSDQTGNGNSGADAVMSDKDLAMQAKAQDMKNNSPQAAARKADFSSTPNSSSGTTSTAATGDFYFYNPATVAFGKTEFRKNWGDRSYNTNWRVTAGRGANNTIDSNVEESITAEEAAQIKATQDKAAEIYTAEYYIKQLPKTRIEIDSISKERNFAYFQLGAIYKEKFKEYKRAADKLEKLLESNPEERLVLPAMYNLYKIYEIIDKDKSIAMKNDIISQFPESRYAQILKNPNAAILGSDTPEVAYGKLYKIFESGDYRTGIILTEDAINQYTGEDIIPKLELLKASIIGKLQGVTEYGKALNFVALNYPNSEEGKQAEVLIGREVPQMEALKFNAANVTSWKILYKADNLQDKKIKALQAKIALFLKNREIAKVTTSVDLYTIDKNFIVLHGMKSEEYAKGIASILKEFKEYKVAETAYVISNDNYKVVQIKKNFEEFLAVGNQPVVLAPIATTTQPVLPQQNIPTTGKAERAARPERANTSTSPQSNAPKSQQQMSTQDPLQNSNPPSMMPPQPTAEELKK